MATLLKPDGTREDVKGANKGMFTIPQVQALIGGYMEVVPTTIPNKVLLVNEDGKRDGLPPNALATAVMRPDAYPGDVIVGNALLVELGKEID